MTDENRRQNIQDELLRAAQSLGAAEALVDLKLYADSVSRSYYGAFHYLRALLLSAGLEPKTHAGALHLFNRDFVRPGSFPTSYNRLLVGLHGSRELADYDAAASFSEDDARTQLADARAFGDDVLALLRKDGWLA